MPRIGNITVSVLREESAATGNLIEALCAAQPEFPPIPLDSDGFRDGHSYRYASISAIRRAVVPALAKHGIWMNHVYGENEGGDYVVTMLRHKTGEYITSTLRIPHISDVQDRKGAMTLLCRTAIEGLLSISTEEDTDASDVQSDEPQDAEPAVDAATKERWRNNLALAEAAVAMATDDATLTRYLNVAKQRVASGDMPPFAVERIKALCDSRSAHLNKEKTSAGDESPAGDEGPDAAGSGRSEQDRKRARRAAGTGA